MKMAVIPARGGSKRIPRKNLKAFAGKPIIGYSIEAALASRLFDHVVVSTDDEEIAETARSFGAEVPFLRPAELCDDHTPTVPVVRHAIQWAEEHWDRPAYVCLIYATAPFVTAERIREGHDVITGNPGTEFAFSATTFPYQIFRALKLREDGTAALFWPENELTRSQDLPEAYHDAGQYCWGTRDAFMTYPWYASPKSRIVILPRVEVQDIDTPEDWASAESLFRYLRRANDSRSS